jgi:hypothetical protein
VTRDHATLPGKAAYQGSTGCDYALENGAFHSFGKDLSQRPMGSAQQAKFDKI